MKNFFIHCLLAGLSIFASLPLRAETADLGSLKDIRIILHTEKGDIEATLFPAVAPVTVANFLNLAKKKYYDGITFHRVVADFMIQGGDPTATGMGGPSYSFEDEFSDKVRFDKAGVFAMANSGPATNGSQFFITHRPTPHLNGKHTIFGQVTKGQEVVNAIAQGDKIKSIEILDEVQDLFSAEGTRIEKWNAALATSSPAAAADSR